MTLRSALLAACLALHAPAASAQPAPERVVNVYNWSDYVDPAMLAAFTRETGIRVVYDTYDNNEILETKLLAGGSGYDVVVPSGPFLQRMIKAGIFRPLDPDRIPERRHLWPEIAARLAVYDPGNRYAVDYMWGTTGIGVNVKAVRARLGDRPLDTWSVLLDPEIAAKLKDCGIHVLDAPEDMFPAILVALGLPADSKKPDDLQKAADALARVRPFIAKFHSSEYINALANGDICVAIGYSGDILQAKKRAEEAGRGVEIRYLLPREGALMWFDSLAIPADAKHPDEAERFIDYLLRPEVASANTNFVRYAGGTNPDRARIAPELLADPGVYPDDATFRRLFTNTAYDERTQRLVTRLWTRIKAGR